MKAVVPTHYHACNLPECAHYGIPSHEVVLQRAKALQRTAELAGRLGSRAIPTLEEIRAAEASPQRKPEPEFLCIECQTDDKAWCAAPQDGRIMSHNCVRIYPHEAHPHLCECGHEWKEADTQ